MIAERSPRNHETSQTLENFLAFCRWFSAFIVILSHTRALSFVGYDALHRTWASKLLLPLYVIGAMADEAVIVFFVLSGFLVGGRAAERALGGRFNLKDYAIDRSTRIYCVLIPALALTVVFDLLGSRWLAGSGLYDATSPILRGRFDLPFQDALGTGTLICNLLSAQPHRCSVYGSNIPLWSLSYEVWFYACAGACCYAYQKHSILSLAGVFAAFSGLVLALGWSGPVYGIFWVAGAVVYLLSRDPLRFGKRFVFAITVIGVAGIIACSRIPILITIDGKLLAVSLFGTASIFSVILYLWAGLRTKPSERVRAFNLALSDFSYSLYITHFPVVVFTLSALIVLSHSVVGRGGGYQPTSWPTLAAFFTAIAIAVLVAWRFSLIFEKGSLLVRRQLKLKLD
jgi:peptidoglycan/LPS O-acetylase OafA/YrhL